MPKVWTFATLIKWINSRFDVVHAMLDERAKATVVAFSNFEKRMDQTNEWRGALNDQTKTMATKQELDALSERVKKVEEALRTSADKSLGFGQLAAILVTAVFVSGALLGIFNALIK